MATAIQHKAEPERNEATLGRGEFILKQADGNPIAVILPWADYQLLLDRLEDLADSLVVREGLEAYARDPLVAQPWEEVEAELIADGLLDKE